MVDAPRISRQSAYESGTGCVYPPGATPGIHFSYRLLRPQGHSACGRIKSIEDHNDPIGNRTRDFLSCSAVPQPTAPPRLLESSYCLNPMVFVEYLINLSQMWRRGGRGCGKKSLLLVAVKASDLL